MTQCAPAVNRVAPQDNPRVRFYLFVFYILWEVMTNQFGGNAGALHMILILVHSLA